jgi:S1-C subfamily serine protease
MTEQPEMQKPSSVVARTPADRSNTLVKSASQTLEENRGSIAVIVAVVNTSVKLGTGFFVRRTGPLLTSLHVVEGMELVGVRAPGGDEVLWANWGGL